MSADLDALRARGLVDASALRRVRLVAGLTQGEAAYAIGVTDRTIRSWENEQHPMPADALGALGRLYRVDDLWSLFVGYDAADDLPSERERALEEALRAFVHSFEVDSRVGRETLQEHALLLARAALAWGREGEREASCG